MPDSINSLSPDIRDFLLNRNLVTDTVLNNGLNSLISGIGVPLGFLGTPPEVVQPSTDIVDDGDFYKDLNLITNKFQGTDKEYTLTNIAYIPISNPSTSAFIYSTNYIEDDGILNNTLNTPPTGPFQGGNVREFNTSKNLYDDPNARSTVNINDILLPNVKYTNYLDLNASVVNKSIDLLGTVLNSQGIGLSPTGGGAIPSFDLRTALVGRVLGGNGVIADTPIGQAGAKYLAFSLANNALFGLNQETLGNLNLNPLNIAKNDLNGIIVPNYDITVPTGQLSRVIDFGARVLGFESPFSLYERGSSIFQSENPISNIDRANAQIANTGKGQVLSLFANIKSNRFRPAFQDDRVRGGEDQYDANGERIEKAAKGSAINPNIYAFGTSEGKIIDFLNTSIDLNEDGSISNDEFDINSPISQSNYNLSGLINNSGFGEVSDGLVDGSTPVSWSDDKNNRDGRSNSFFNEPKSLLYKTQGLFRTNKMRTIVSGHGGNSVQGKSQIESAVKRGFISKGSGVLSSNALNSSLDNPSDVFCRTWTTFDRYNKVEDLQKSSSINKNTAFRNGYDSGDSVLGDNGFVKIAPYMDDLGTDIDESKIKNYMFSIENLAWADNKEMLLDCEKGPGDPMGKSGRIMWFPPYDLAVTENTSVNWESTNFIGRGEPIYTYNNTERTGTLQFKIVVDHPSYLNAIKSESDDYIASFFAGCTDIDSELAKKLTTIEREEILIRNTPDPQIFRADYTKPDIPKVDFYFSNDNYELNPLYENGDGNGLGTTVGQKIVSRETITFTDENDFGLNGVNNPSVGSTGGWITTETQDKLKKGLNLDCQACKIVIEGHASTQGSDITKNLELSQLRADAVKSWFIDNIIDSTQDIYTNKITVDNRFSSVEGQGITGCERGQGERQDEECLKLARKVNVSIVWDSELQDKIENNEKNPVVRPAEKFRVSQRIINRFYNECNYFEKLRQEDATVYSSIKEKLKFFHPAFHAITPEGLNSRLTFLQQCTRQGPTDITGKPDNLAFGRPPVCILRLGDFYHTKIIIDNIGLSYEPLVWDLNPEGIGVQPMIATVDLSFKMIGGQSMKGPINKLQNAVSFNFFGNTQVYDERADKLKVNTVPNKSKNEIIRGKEVLYSTKQTTIEEIKTGINGNSDNTVSIDQLSLANLVVKQEQGITLDDTEVIKRLGIKSISYDSESELLDIIFKFNNSDGGLLKFSEEGVNTDINIYIINSTNMDKVKIYTVNFSYNDPTSILVTTNDGTLVIGQAALNFAVGVSAIIDDELINKVGSSVKGEWVYNNKVINKNNINFS